MLEGTTKAGAVLKAEIGYLQKIAGQISNFTTGYTAFQNNLEIGEWKPKVLLMPKMKFD